MANITERFISCDFALERGSDYYDVENVCQINFGEQEKSTWRNFAELRVAARSNEWTRFAGKDICPSCRARLDAVKEAGRGVE